MARRCAGATTNTGKRTLPRARSLRCRQAGSIRAGCAATARRSAGASSRSICRRDNGSGQTAERGGISARLTACLRAAQRPLARVGATVPVGAAARLTALLGSAPGGNPARRSRAGRRGVGVGIALHTRRPANARGGHRPERPPSERRIMLSSWQDSARPPTTQRTWLIGACSASPTSRPVEAGWRRRAIREGRRAEVRMAVRSAIGPRGSVVHRALRSRGCRSGGRGLQATRPSGPAAGLGISRSRLSHG